LLGFDKLSMAASLLNGAKPFQGQDKDAFSGGKQLGLVDFAGEPWVPLDTPLGAELDGRLYTDLARLTPEPSVTPIENFYIRTRASQLLEDPKPWAIRLGGLVRQPLDLTQERWKNMAKPAGVHLMECAGNARNVHFGMLSAADWAGVPLLEVLDMVKADARPTLVLISGFDRYRAESATSVPGASWIFTVEQLKSARAFLATEMNGRPLTRDHGAPVRLVVPGWYGCACIKWVNEIALVGDDTEATSQMREYASRTDQTGMPSLAKNYKPASIEPSAIPIRIEKWLVGAKIKYRVAGIEWGGSRPVNALEIRFNPEEDYVPVERFSQTAHDSWSFWTHVWVPRRPDTYSIRLRVRDPSVPTKRMDAGAFVRSIEVTEV